jgi:catechol 2,3-dioxygenase-like lactoylglutathione lyase family enzyme
VFIDHFSLGVADLARSARFYDAVLAAIGAGRLFERPDFIWYGTSKTDFSCSIDRTISRGR